MYSYTYGFSDFPKLITVTYDNIRADTVAYGSIWLHMGFLTFK